MNASTGNGFVVIKENVRDMVKALNEVDEERVGGRAVHFEIEKDASRCLREYVDVLLTDVANKFVVMVKHDRTLNRNQAMQRIECKKQRERKILDTVLAETHFKDEKKKVTLRNCFLDHSEMINSKTTLNPIFLK